MSNILKTKNIDIEQKILNYLSLEIINLLIKDTIKKNFSLVNLHGKKRVNYIKEELNKINKTRKNSFKIENKRFMQSNNLNKKYKYRITKLNKNKSLEIVDNLKYGESVCTIKKINSHKYGECLLLQGKSNNGQIKLWKNMNQN